MKSQFLVGLAALILSLFATEALADCATSVQCGGQWVPASPQVAYAPPAPAYGYGQVVYVVCGTCGYAPQAYAQPGYPQMGYGQPVFPQAAYAPPCLPCQGPVYAPPQEVQFTGEYEGGVGGYTSGGYGGFGGGGPEIAQVTGYGNISGFVGSHMNGSAGAGATTSTTTNVNVSASAYANASASAHASGGGHNGHPGGCGCHRPPPPPRPCGCGHHH
ncbi:MAG: hypothetical protein AB1429_04985 [Pseudomonadota bacterium]|jgi:hypothetical protein